MYLWSCNCCARGYATVCLAVCISILISRNNAAYCMQERALRYAKLLKMTETPTAACVFFCLLKTRNYGSPNITAHYLRIDTPRALYGGPYFL